MGYVIPYHTKKLQEDFNIGFGINSMKGKEPKHSVIQTEVVNEIVGENGIRLPAQIM